METILKSAMEAVVKRFDDPGISLFIEAGARFERWYQIELTSELLKQGRIQVVTAEAADGKGGRFDLLINKAISIEIKTIVPHRPIRIEADIKKIKKHGSSGFLVVCVVGPDREKWISYRKQMESVYQVLFKKVAQTQSGVKQWISLRSLSILPEHTFQ